MESNTNATNKIYTIKLKLWLNLGSNLESEYDNFRPLIKHWTIYSAETIGIFIDLAFLTTSDGHVESAITKSKKCKFSQDL